MFDIWEGKEAGCDIVGKYVSIHRPGKNWLTLAGVAVFIECNLETLPFDTLLEATVTVEKNSQASFEALSIANELEAALGVDVCGELKLDIIDLPPFCIYDDTTFIVTCSPTLPEHEGSWSFTVTRQALEHPLTLRENTFKVEVPLPPKPAPAPEPNEEEEPEIIAPPANDNPI